LVEVLAIRYYQLKFSPNLVVNEAGVYGGTTDIAIVLIDHSSDGLALLAVAVPRTIDSKFFAGRSFENIITAFYVAFYVDGKRILHLQ